MNIVEFSSSLSSNSINKYSIFELLNKLEKLAPIEWINAQRIYPLELLAAKEAFSNNCEYKDINPLVQRFDETLDINSNPSTKYLIDRSIAETINRLLLASPPLLKPIPVEELKKLYENDRVLREPPTLKIAFINTVNRHLNEHKINLSRIITIGLSENVATFAKWIYEDPLRCPSIRLGFEVYHKRLKNRTDVNFEQGDMNDFAHIDCIPYVDLAILEKKSTAYIFQASKSIKSGYELRLKSIDEMIDYLSC